MTKTTRAVKTAPKYNATLWALLDAFARKVPDAWGPLGDHLEELGAEDLAEMVRDHARRGGMLGKRRESPKRVALFVTGYALNRGLLAWTDRREHDQALAFQAALAKLNPAIIRPVATPPRPFKEEAALLRRFLSQHGIPHVSVRVHTYSMGGCVRVEFPLRQDHTKHGCRETVCAACESNYSTDKAFRAVLAPAFPKDPSRGGWSFQMPWGVLEAAARSEDI
jgi:hypothetical protein